MERLLIVVAQEGESFKVLYIGLDGSEAEKAFDSAKLNIKLHSVRLFRWPSHSAIYFPKQAAEQAESDAATRDNEEKRRIADEQKSASEAIEAAKKVIAAAESKLKKLSK